MTLHLDRRQTCGLLLGTALLPTTAAVLPAAPTWSRQAGLYEVNLRQFTPEGTLRAFEAHLPRLQRLGVTILWLMPIHPIGLEQRKGTLGSYYAVRDYTAVNPEFGTLADLQRVVRRAHTLGMRVILDWVANHTAWDHPWITLHPDWYQKDAQGRIGPFSHVFVEGKPPEVWADVVGLDYRAPALWAAMTDAMLYWVREAGIDGYRCDVAGLVPLAFWQQARAKLDAVRPVFMLAEADLPVLHDRAFDMTYDWALYETLKTIAKGQADAGALRTWWQQRQAKYPPGALGMNFTGNHDSNSWDGSDAEYYGSVPAFQAMAVLAALLPGMPLIYGGQEAYFEKRLQFFEKDLIAWKDTPLAGFYARLMRLKRTHPALANPPHGGTLQWHELDNDGLAAWTLRRGRHRCTVTVNVTPRMQAWKGTDGLPSGTLPPWGWSLRTA